jgi:hypothetical protein
VTNIIFLHSRLDLNSINKFKLQNSFNTHKEGVETAYVAGIAPLQTIKDLASSSALQGS